MSSDQSPHRAPLTTDSERTAYVKAARMKLMDSRTKLDGLAIAARQAVETGRLAPGTRLDRALEAMEAGFGAADARLRLLQQSGDGEWHERRADLESAWEDLAHTIKILVARLADGTGTEFV